MQLEDFIWFQNFTIFDYLFCIATKLKFDIIVELQWHNRLARRTYRQYLPRACRGRVMRRLRVRASPGASVFDWPVRTSIRVFCCYWNAFHRNVHKQRNGYFFCWGNQVTYFIRKHYAPGEDRTLDLQIALYVIMRLTRCLLRYRGTYKEPSLNIF